MEWKSRVVLIHSNRDVRRKLANGLVKARFEVLEAEGRSDGLPLIYQVRPVVIFLEVDEEREETWETCSRIQLFTNTPLVLLAESLPSPTRAPLIADNARVLQAPYTAPQALDAVRELLNQAVNTSPPPTPSQEPVTAVSRTPDAALQDQLTWLSALLSKIKRASGAEQIVDSIVLNHLLGILQADWIALFHGTQCRTAGPGDVDCEVWPGRSGWTEELELFFSARAREAIASQRLIVRELNTPGSAATQRPGAAHAVGDYILIPLLGRDRVYGALAVIRRPGERGRFSTVQVQFVNTVGETLALAMDNADLVRQLHDAAIVDRRTGIFSTAYLERIVSMEKERRNRYGRPFSLILMDWATGQAAGPHAQMAMARALQQVASQVQHQLRATDVIARHGDTGIAFVLPETDSSQAQHVAERLMRLVDADKLGALEYAPEFKTRVSTTLDD